MTHPSPTIAVTGLGVVSAWGWSRDEFWTGLLKGKTRIDSFQRFEAASYRTQVASEVDIRPLADSLGCISIADQFALAATQEALHQAGIDLLIDSPGRSGVFFATCTGGMFEAENYYSELLGLTPRQTPLKDLATQQYNSPGDAVARTVGVNGPVVAFSSACTSGAIALGAAFDALQTGEVDIAITGGADSLCRLTYAGFNALRAVDTQPSLPFRSDRAGLSLGEGSATLILERLDDALARGATPLALMLGVGSTCDAFHMTAPQPEGLGAAAAIQAALKNARLSENSVDFIVAHGTGTPLNDAAEWKAFQRVFQDRTTTIPVTTPKSSIGHLLGSAGSIEAVATVLCLQNQLIHPMPPGGDMGEEIPARLVLGEPLHLPKARVGVSTNLAFGGSNTAVVFSRWERNDGL